MAERTIYQRLTLFSVVVMALAGGCGYNHFDDLQLPDNQSAYGNIGIRTLQTWHGGGNEVKRVYDDYVIIGCVTANDRSENFYRTFMLQELGAAIEIRAGIYDLHPIVQRGRVVAINTKNLAIDTYSGVLRLGSYDNGRVGYIAARYVPGEYFMPQDKRCVVEPRKLTIDELTDKMCGQLVRIEGLKVVDTEPVTWEGDRVFSDGGGRLISVDTSPYADFAGDKIPQKRLALTGVLIKKSMHYGIKLRDLNDVEE